MLPSLRTLIIEDCEDDFALLVCELKRYYALEFSNVQTSAAMEAALEKERWDIVFTDYNLPEFSGPEAIHLLKTKQPTTPIIVVSGTIGEVRAVELVMNGADDYVMKDNLARLLASTQRALKASEDRRKRNEAESALKKTEEHMRQLQRLEAIGNLAGGVAHDFNNLLMIIMGYSDMVLGKLGPNDSMRPEIEQIRKAGTRGANLTRQLLAFGRRQVQQPRSIDLNALIIEINKMIRRLLPQTVEIDLCLSPDLKRITFDPGQMEQVLMNLVINARDAMPDGGRITIETANVTLSEEYARTHVSARPGPHVMLAVADNGCGMDAQTLERIFEPFFTTKELGRGTGLGLSTVYGIIKQAKGNIWVYSEVGRGSVFKVYLPQIDGTPTSGEHPSVVMPAVAAGSVLLVDAHQEVREMMGAILRQAGYVVIDATNSESALKSTEGVELLITDMVMPKMTGFALAERLRERLPNLKVLYTSGYSPHFSSQPPALTDSDSFLEKPFTPNALIKKVHDICKRGPNPSL
jgi:two-component system, cell cycle sensor histidine kinase and response regulator CckA